MTVNTSDVVKWQAAPIAVTVGSTTTILSTGIVATYGGMTTTIAATSSTNLGASGTIQLLSFPDNSNVQVVFDADVISSNNLREIVPQCRDVGVTASTSNGLSQTPIGSNYRGNKNLFDGQRISYLGAVKNVSLLEFPWNTSSIKPFLTVRFGQDLGLNTPFALTMMLRYLNVLLS
jgi:hypothetical protein